MQKNKTPKHYQLTIEPVEYIMANNLNFCEGNVVKYISRYKQKGGLEDLFKAKDYIDILINNHKENDKNN